MKKFYDLIENAGVMPTLFVEDAECIARVISAIEKTGMPAVEILQRGEEAKKALKQAAKIKKNAYIGAGTVCTVEQCKEMVDLGADFLVSPGFNPQMIDWCVKNNVPVIPGTTTTSEVMLAANAGLKILKAYPFFECGGVRYFECISGPFPDVKFVATGYLGEEHLNIVSSNRIAAAGGVWMFQGEEDHTVVSEEEIITRLNHSISVAKGYKAGILNK